MPQGKEFAKLLKNKKLIVSLSILLVFILIGIFLRTIGLPSGNSLFLFDNGRDLLFVKKIVIDHHLILIGPSSGGLQGYFHGVLWYYLLSIPFLIGKGNPLAITSFVAFLSLLSIPTSFFILKKISGLNAAIIGSLFFTFSYFSVQTAKYPWNPYPIVWLMPFFFLAIYLISNKKRSGFFLASFLIGLFIHFEAIYGITLIPTFILILLIGIRGSKGLIRLRNLFLDIFVFLLPALPTLIFDLRHNFLVTSSLLRIFYSGGMAITHSNTEKVLSPLVRFNMRLTDLFSYSINSLTPSILINIIVFTVGLISLIIVFKRLKNHVLILLVIFSIFTPLFIFTTLKYSVWSYYWIGTSPLYALFIAYLIGEISNLRKKLFYGVAFISLLAIFLFNPIFYMRNWHRGDLSMGTTNFNTEIKIVNTIKNNAGGKPFSVYVSTPPVYDYVYRYLFWWKGYYGDKLFPNDLKQENIYVILERNETGIFEENYFLKSVVKTSITPQTILNTLDVKVLKIKTLPGEEPFNSNFLPSI